jgi:hypothetical protein
MWFLYKTRPSGTRILQIDLPNKKPHILNSRYGVLVVDIHFALWSRLFHTDSINNFLERDNNMLE